MFTGMISALVTPFHTADKGYAIDWDSFDALIEWQIEKGVDGVVLYGTTGESPTLSHDEKLQITKRAIDIIRGRIPIVVGAGSNSTQGTIDFISSISSYAIDGVLLVAPYYNKPTQEGLFQHFSHVANQSFFPSILYNVPSRTSVEISIDTIERLSKCKGVVAIKQATDSVQNITELCRRLADSFSILAGDDPLTAYGMALGGKGVISASGSVIPEDMVSIVRAAQKGDYVNAMSIQKNSLEKINALFIETNPVPAKAILKHKGIIANDVPRLPLVPLSEGNREKIVGLFT